MQRWGFQFVFLLAEECLKTQTERCGNREHVSTLVLVHSLTLDTFWTGRSKVEVEKIPRAQCIPRHTSSPTPTLFIICRHLVTERCEVLLGLAVDGGGLFGLGHLPSRRLLALVVCGALDLPALLEAAIC